MLMAVKHSVKVLRKEKVTMKCKLKDEFINMEHLNIVLVCL